MNKQTKKVDNLIMDEQQFAHLVESYGGEAKRWPPEYRAAAHHLLDRSISARRLQQAALALDNLLDTVQISPPSPRLRQRILANVRRTATTTHDIWQRFLQWIIGTTPTEHLWRPAVTFVLPLLLGILLGFYSTQALYTETKVHLSSTTTEFGPEMSLFSLSNNDLLE
jgi:hypothetical protein